MFSVKDFMKHRAIDQADEIECTTVLILALYFQNWHLKSCFRGSNNCREEYCIVHRTCCPDVQEQLT